MIKPIHYQLSDWSKAFSDFFKRRKAGEEVSLVLSTHTYSEGYWIESEPKPRPGDFVYDNPKDVIRLAKDIIKNKGIFKLIT